MLQNTKAYRIGKKKGLLLTMSQVQRILREKIYYYRRKRLQKNKKNVRFQVTKVGQLPVDFKKIIGLALLIIGLLLLLTKCFFGGKEQKEEAKENFSTTYVAEVSPVPSATSSYYAYFQAMHFTSKELEKLFKIALKEKQSFAHLLAIWTNENFKGTSPKVISKSLRRSAQQTTLTDARYLEGKVLYEQFIYDIQYFPIANKQVYTYENSWKQKRTNKGEPDDYGIDIMEPKNISGKVKIVSMTDGTIENIGWDEVGGYHVGIRSEGGAYFYYAHLHEMPKHIKKGEKIGAGEYIGLMGNTGSIGIALLTKENKKLWINPYPILQYLEKNKSDV